jgi:glycosyltransferase involved in cell wall biosynthesis
VNQAEVRDKETGSVGPKGESRTTPSRRDAPQPSPPPVSVMIFTLNEELHLATCLRALAWCDDVIVIDSFSTDRTKSICEEFGARFFERAFDGFGTQRNWALENTSPRHDWVLILDADERVTPGLVAEMRDVLTRTDAHVGAFRVRRRFHMWGRWLRFSNLYPTWVVRLINRHRVRYDNRGHSETQRVEGEIRGLDHDLIDENFKGIQEWFERQARYAYKEATYELSQDASPPDISNLLCQDPLARRSALKQLTRNVPGRALGYFLYAFVLRGGFLEGKDGLMFCSMRAVYQQMVVASKHELRRRQGR